jgi:hypothetical protein
LRIAAQLRSDWAPRGFPDGDDFVSGAGKGGRPLFGVPDAVRFDHRSTT